MKQTPIPIGFMVKELDRMAEARGVPEVVLSYELGRRLETFSDLTLDACKKELANLLSCA